MSLKQKIQEKIDAFGDTTSRSMHDNVKGKIAAQNQKEAFKEVLGLLDDATKQVDKIMCEDYWTANFHLNQVRSKILAVLEGEKK